MSSADNSEYSDELLTRYLLGAVKANESERLDERSIADNELAWRLDALEHDLVDAFVRNELSGETLEQFKTFYLSSPARKAKVELARTLLNWSEERASTREMAGDKQVEHAPAASANHATGVRFGWLQWGLAAAAIVLCAFAFYLFEENNRLRKLQNEVQEQQTHHARKNDGRKRERGGLGRTSGKNGRRAADTAYARLGAHGDGSDSGRYGNRRRANAAGIG